MEQFTGEAYCACGITRFASEAEARKAQPDGSHKCPECHTFSKAHEWYGDAFSDYRCYECDTRAGSHGGPNPPFPVRRRVPA